MLEDNATIAIKKQRTANKDDTKNERFSFKKSFLPSFPSKTYSSELSQSVLPVTRKGTDVTNPRHHLGSFETPVA